MSGNAVSFFDDKLEDESISLSDSELNNIFNVDVAQEASAEEAQPQYDDAEMLRSEPDVIVVEKKDLSSLYSPSPAVPVINGDAIPSDEFVEAVEMPTEAEVAEATELSLEPEMAAESIEEISPMDQIEDETPAMATLDGEETLPIAEELSLEELTGEQPSEIAELESFPDLPVTKEVNAVPDNADPMYADLQAAAEASLVEEMPIFEESSSDTVEIPVEAEAMEVAEEPVEMPELVESQPESVEEVLTDGTITFDEPAMADSGMVEELPSLNMIDSSVAEEILPEETIAEELALDASSFEDVAPVEFADSSELGSTDQIVLDDNPQAPEELNIEENVPEIVLEESSSDTMMSMAEPEEVNLDEISLVEDDPATMLNDRGEVTEEHTIFSGDEPPKQKVDNASSYFGDIDEDEAITLSTDELSNILDNAEVEEKSGVAVEPDPAFSSTPVVSSDDRHVRKEQEPADELFETVDSSLSRENLKEVFVYIDNLLDKLPEVEIQKFARSKYYDIYNRIFEELGII